MRRIIREFATAVEVIHLGTFKPIRPWEKSSEFVRFSPDVQAIAITSYQGWVTLEFFKIYCMSTS